MNVLMISEFERVRPLFRAVDYQRPAVFAVLEGTQAGRVFVDRRHGPAAVLVWGCFYNVESENLAQKLGFTYRRDVEVTYVTSRRTGGASHKTGRIHM